MNIKHRVELNKLFRLLRITGEGCWELGKVDNSGYTYVDVSEGRMRGHRYIYELFWGKISENKVLDHLCKNKRCINPFHLEEVTQVENVRRGKVNKLGYKLKNIFDLYKLGYSQKEIAKKFCVSQSAISRVVNHKRWVYGTDGI